MFGGALFAAFPLFYAVSFGGAYFVWMAILFSFIVLAVAYEYRKKPDNLYGTRFYETLLFINGSVGIFLIGAALGTLFSGGNFIVNEMNLSQWTVASYGLEAVLNPFNVAFGLMLVFISRVLGALYFFNNLNAETITQRVKKVLIVNFGLFLMLFIYVFMTILFSDGYRYDATTHIVSVESMKFLNSFIHMPILTIALIIGVVTLTYGIYTAVVKESTLAIWSAGLGVVISVTVLLLILGLDNSVYYPSLVDLQSSLTIENSSGSHYTLSVMSVVSLLVLVVATYIFFVWRSMDKTKLTIEEINADPHHY